MKATSPHRYIRYVCNTLILIISSIDAIGQSSPMVEDTFLSPVAHKIVLAGSFGEIRATHFHTGLDIKPSVSGAADPIRCSKSGYVSRIKINRSGYGRAIYVDHLDGHTTVYAHLQSLSTKLDTIVLAVQRQMQSYEIEIFPEPGEILLDQGEVIGLMGNSGRSYGPHLHYEIRRTATEAPVNPFAFGIMPTDRIKPTLAAISINVIGSDWQILDRQIFTYDAIPALITSVGSKIGIAVDAYDQMDGAGNKNGVYQKELYLNEQLIYKQTIQEIRFEEMEQLKSHVDYAAKINLKKTMSQLYCLPSYQMIIIDTCVNQGLILLDQVEPMKVRVVLTDFHGNVNQVSFDLQSKEGTLQDDDTTYNLYAKADQDNELKTTLTRLHIPKGSLQKNERISVAFDDTGISIGKEEIPILGYIDLYIKVDTSQYINPHQLALVYIDEGKLIDYGTSIFKDGLHAAIGSFGKYQVYIDSVAPKIAAQHYPIPKDGYFTFTIKDDVEPKHKAKDFTYEVWTQGQFVPCEFKSLGDVLYIPTSAVSSNFTIIATDQKGNTTSKTFSL